jgi:hypothetical protein
MTNTVTTTTTIYDVDDEGEIALDQEHAAEHGGWRKDTAFVHCDMEARLLYSGPVPEIPRELDTGDYEPFRWVAIYRCAVCSAVFEKYRNPLSYPTFWADVSSGTLPLEETEEVLDRMWDDWRPYTDAYHRRFLARRLYIYILELLGRKEPSRVQDNRYTDEGFIYMCRLLGIPVKEMTVPHVPCAKEYCEYGCDWEARMARGPDGSAAGSTT